MSETKRSSKGSGHSFDLSDYLSELTGIHHQAQDDLASAGERALKVLDGFLADYATSLGLNNDRPSMYDSIQFLETLGGQPQSISARADRYRSTRNALAHNSDLTLRPAAARRIIDGVEKLIRSAARNAGTLARRPPECVDVSDLARDARDHMIDQGYRQLVVTDAHGKLVDVLTYRDIVAVESLRDLDGDGDGTTVGELVERRDYRAAAPVPRTASIGEVADALSDEQTVAAVVTENGKFGEAPLGVITRGDILRIRS